MIPVTAFAGKHVAVFGLGSSGLASCAALKAGGGEVIAFDDDSAKVAAAASRGIATCDLRHIDWTGIAAFVLSPGVPLTHPAPHWSVALAREAAVEIIGDIELYCRERRAKTPGAPFVAVTGTNGKSTTTALIAHVLAAGGIQAQRGGNIGVAILSLDPPAPGRAHVIECSSYQIDLAPSLDPSVGILLNVSPDHLDRHGTIRRYAAIKARLVEGVPANGAAIKPSPAASRERWRASAASARCAAGTMPRMPPALPRRRSRSGSRRRRSSAACGRFRASPTAWSRSAAGAACCSSTIPRRPMPMPPPGR